MRILLNSTREKIFKKHFLEPVQRLQELGKIENPKENSKKYRHEWLQQGRQNFDNPNIPNCELNPQELVDLYCYYYLPMHYSSSLMVFSRETNTLLEICNPKNSVHFIDIGCGPGTSGIAFNHWMEDNMKEKGNVRYYGIDNSKAMRDKAKQLLKVR